MNLARWGKLEITEEMLLYRKLTEPINIKSKMLTNISDVISYQ
jgi:hypothetical protein